MADQVKKPISEAEKKRLHDEHRYWMRLIVTSAFVGAAIGVFIAWVIIYFDLGNMGSLLSRATNRIGFTALFVAGFASLFGMISMGVAIMFETDRQNKLHR